MADLETDVPKQIENLLGHFFDVGRNLAASVAVEQHHIDVAERIEFAASVPAESNQGQRSLRLFDCVRRRGEHVAENYINQLAASRANLAATAAGLMF